MLTEIFFQTQIPHSFFLAWQRAQSILFTLLSIVYENLQILKRIPFLFYFLAQILSVFFFLLALDLMTHPPSKWHIPGTIFHYCCIHIFFFIYFSY